MHLLYKLPVVLDQYHRVAADTPEVPVEGGHLRVVLQVLTRLPPLVHVHPDHARPCHVPGHQGDYYMLLHSFKPE